uniref:Uncharacterized protein n=1 Tax=Anguilla anguilla TaxID=7936 RepID=A0A0E9TUT5_ANGAN
MFQKMIFYVCLILSHISSQAICINVVLNNSIKTI